MIDEDTQIIGKLADLERKLHAPMLEQWRKRARNRFGVASALLLISLGTLALIGPTVIPSEVSKYIFFVAFIESVHGRTVKLRRISAGLEQLEFLTWAFVMVSILGTVGPDVFQRVLETRLVWIALLVNAIVQLPRSSREFEEALLTVKRVP